MDRIASISHPDGRGNRGALEVAEQVRPRKIATRAVADQLDRIACASGGWLAIYARRADRMRACGEWLEVGIMGDGSGRLLRASWCRDRLCPMCAWRRSRRNAAVLQTAVDLRHAEDGGRWVHIVLTVRNIVPDDLASALSIMMNAWNRLWKRDEWMGCYVGVARSLEITYNQANRTYHPHLHILAECAPGYYDTLYISQERLAELWLECLGNQYGADMAHVWMRPADRNADGSSARDAVREVSKYIVRVDDLPDMPLDDLEALAEAVHGRRLVAYTGTVRRAIKMLGADADGESMDDFASSNIPISRAILRWSQAGSAYYIDESVAPDDLGE